jgi:hypothetical protein
VPPSICQPSRPSRHRSGAHRRLNRPTSSRQCHGMERSGESKKNGAGSARRRRNGSAFLSRRSDLVEARGRFDEVMMVRDSPGWTRARADGREDVPSVRACMVEPSVSTTAGKTNPSQRPHAQSKTPTGSACEASSKAAPEVFSPTLGKSALGNMWSRPISQASACIEFAKSKDRPRKSHPSAPRCSAPRSTLTARARSCCSALALDLAFPQAPGVTYSRLESA